MHPKVPHPPPDDACAICGKHTHRLVEFGGRLVAWCQMYGTEVSGKLIPVKPPDSLIPDFAAEARAMAFRIGAIHEIEPLEEMFREIARLKAENESLRKEVEVDDTLLAQDKELIDLFDCPLHGPRCIPHAVEEVKKLRENAARLANENAALVAQIGTGFMFPRDGEARLIE